MPKKIKKRSKKKDHEELPDQGALLVAPAEESAGTEDAQFEEAETFGDIMVDIPDHERDKFQEASYKAANWVEDNRPAAIGLFLALCLIPVLAYAAYHYMEQQEVEASATVSQSLKLYQNPVAGSEAMKFFEQNDKFEAPKTVYPSEKEKWSTIYDQASKSLAAAKGKDLEAAATYMLAAAAYQTGKYKEAVGLYQDVLGRSEGKPIAPVATLSLAMSQAGGGMWTRRWRHLRSSRPLTRPTPRWRCTTPGGCWSLQERSKRPRMPTTSCLRATRRQPTKVTSSAESPRCDRKSVRHHTLSPSLVSPHACLDVPRRRPSRSPVPAPSSWPLRMLVGVRSWGRGRGRGGGQ